MGNTSVPPDAARCLPGSLPGAEAAGTQRHLGRAAGLQQGGAGWASSEVGQGWMEPGTPRAGPGPPPAPFPKRRRAGWGAARERPDGGGHGAHWGGTEPRSGGQGDTRLPLSHPWEPKDLGRGEGGRGSEGQALVHGRRWTPPWRKRPGRARQRGSGAGGSQHLVRVRQRWAEEPAAPTTAGKHGRCRGQGAARTCQPPHHDHRSGARFPGSRQGTSMCPQPAGSCQPRRPEPSPAPIPRALQHPVPREPSSPPLCQLPRPAPALHMARCPGQGDAAQEQDRRLREQLCIRSLEAPFSC